MPEPGQWNGANIAGGTPEATAAETFKNEICLTVADESELNQNNLTDYHTGMCMGWNFRKYSIFLQ